MSQAIRVNSIDDLLPTMCDGVELITDHADRWTHLFAVPSRLFAGHWHLGYSSRTGGDHDNYCWSEAPVPAAEFLRFVEAHEPFWSTGLMSRWCSTGLEQNPLEFQSIYSGRLFDAIRKGYQ